jgi:hypothetical protein
MSNVMNFDPSGLERAAMVYLRYIFIIFEK